ncbi:MAG: hypothetical protein WKF40_10280 [Thermoleophilaceae bacterium]
MIRLAVRAPATQAELVLAALLELAPSGIEQVDGDGWIEFAVYGSPGELPELAEGEAEVAGVQVVVSGTEIADDWEERWKQLSPAGARSVTASTCAHRGSRHSSAPASLTSDRSRPRLRYRLPPDDAAVPGAAARGGRAGRRGSVVRPRLRLGRAVDRRGQARFRSDHGPGRRPPGDRGHRGKREGQRRSAGPASTAPTCARRRRRMRTWCWRTLCTPCCCGWRS